MNTAAQRRSEATLHAVLTEAGFRRSGTGYMRGDARATITSSTLNGRVEAVVVDPLFPVPRRANTPVVLARLLRVRKPPPPPPVPKPRREYLVHDAHVGPCRFPCEPCRWRTLNHPGNHDELGRIWRLLRAGDLTAARCEPAPGRVHPCSGALILVLREVAAFESLCGRVPDPLVRYEEERPGGLTRAGLFAIVQRVLADPASLEASIRASPAALDFPAVSCPALTP